MTERSEARQAAGRPGRHGRFASWAAALMAAAAAAALALGATTPPRSGPFCQDACITYPYTAAVAFVPRDYLWMYPAAIMALAFVVVVACLHERATRSERLFTRIALAFAVIAAATLVVDYFIQLAVVQPSLLKGELAGLSLVSQYNPHGVFIALEDLGFLMMGVAFLGMAGGLRGRDRLERSARYVLLVGGVLAVAALAVLAPLYGSDLEYRYEVVVIVVDWLTLIIGGILLALLFRRDARGPVTRDESAPSPESTPT